MSASVGSSPLYLTTEQVAQMLQIGPRYVARCGIPQVKLGHKVRRYSVKAVEAFLAQRTSKPKTKKRRRS